MRRSSAPLPWRLPGCVSRPTHNFLCPLPQPTASPPSHLPLHLDFRVLISWKRRLSSHRECRPDDVKPIKGLGPRCCSSQILPVNLLHPLIHPALLILPSQSHSLFVFTNTFLRSSTLVTFHITKMVSCACIRNPASGRLWTLRTPPSPALSPLPCPVGASTRAHNH